MPSPASARRREYEQWGVVCLVAVSSWLAFRFYTGVVLEDALITWRYAEHLAQGAGFTFNAGERVLGTTTPMLAVILGGAAMITGTKLLPFVAVALMIACGAAAGWFVYRALRSAGFTHIVSLIAVATLMLHADFVWSTVGGMETPLVLLLMAVSLFASVSERYYVAAMACAVLPFVRLDTIIWVLLVVLHAVWYGKSKIVRPAIAGLLLAVAGAAVLTAYFGSPVPHSVIAKRAVGPSVGALTWYSVQQWFNWIVGASAVNPFGGRIERVAFVPWLAIVTLGGALMLRRSTTRRLWPLAAFPPAIAVAFLLSGAPHFLWYLVPFTACLCVVGGIGVAHLIEARWPAARPVARAGMLAAIGLVVAAFAHTARSTTDWHWRNQRNEWQVRQAIGEWLSVHTRADSRVLMEAIGYQGTLSGRRVIDLAGLITPRVVELQRESHSNADAFAKILREFAPDFVVLRTIEVEQNQHFYGGVLFETTASAAAFRSSYRPVATFRAPYPEIWHTGSSLTIYSRTSAQRLTE